MSWLVARFGCKNFLFRKSGWIRLLTLGLCNAFQIQFIETAHSWTIHLPPAIMIIIINEWLLWMWLQPWEFRKLKWKSRRMKSVCFLHRMWMNSIRFDSMVKRSWKFVSGGEWFDLYTCGICLMYGTTVIKFVCVYWVWFIIVFPYISVSIFYKVGII